MTDPRSVARTAVNRLSAVLDALAHKPSSINAVIDVSEPLFAAFDALFDQIDALRREVTELKQAR